jgi:hypothetical protein
MRERRSVAMLGIAMTGLFALFSLVPGLIPSQRFLFLYFFFYLVIVPGYLLAARFLPWSSGFVRLLVSFVMGTGLAFAFLFVIALFRWDIRILGFCVPPVVVVLSLLHRPRARSGEERGDTAPPPWPSTGKAEQAVLIALLLGVSLLILSTGDPLIYTSDSADHIAYVRTISRSHEAFPEQWYYRGGGMLTHDIRRGLLHALWGTLNSLTGKIDVLPVWVFISLIASVFFIIALFCAGEALFGTPVIGVIAGFLFVFIYARGLRDFNLIRMAYGNAFGQIFYVTGLAFLPSYVRKPRPGYLLLIAASFFAATGTHINLFSIVLFLLFIAALIAILHARGAERIRMLFKRIPLLALVVLATNLPYVMMRYVRDYAPKNPTYMHVQGILYFTDKVYVLNPSLFFRVVGPLGMLSMISIVLLWKRTRTDDALRLLLYGLLAFYILVFNPLWFPMMHEKMLYLLVRFEGLVPSTVVSAYLLFELWKWARRREHALSTPRAVVGLLAVAMCVGYPLAKLPGSFAYTRGTIERLLPDSCRNLKDMYRFINAHCPPGKVFLSDVFTSFSIPAFTDEYVVCSLDQHSVPNDSTAEVRIADCRDFFDPSTSLRAMGNILEKYGADYVVANGRIPAGLVALYWKPDLAAARALTDRLANAGPAFELLYEHDNLALFRFFESRASSLSSAPGPMPFVGDSVRAVEIGRSMESGLPGILIEEVEASPDRVPRGDTVQVRITWVSERKEPLRRYAGYLRFNTSFPKSVLYRAAYGKLYRKALERVEGERYRFRVEFLPLEGIAAPDTWPALREIHDTVTVAVPRDVAPGAYTISLKMGITPQFPNYHLSDFFNDHDYYSGVVVSRISIE